MPEYLEKLRPDRDLQCYFERPSAIAALSSASSEGFKVTGSWRQAFDWAVVEWNRDNGFEHPAFRYLPDGNLSGLTLSYEEVRRNCIPLDSDLYPTVSWPYLRIWTEEGEAEGYYEVRLLDHATPVDGDSVPASAVFELEGTPTGGDYVELAWLSEHHTYQLYGADSLEDAARAIADSINRFSETMDAQATGTAIRLSWKIPGNNGNRIGVYGNLYRQGGTPSERWKTSWQTLSGGNSPTKWRVDINFADLRVRDSLVPTTNVRKMRWTWAANHQPGTFARDEFEIEISNWTVSGDNRRYKVAGPGTLRVEDNSADLGYTGSWLEQRGNNSGGSVKVTAEPGASVHWDYSVPQHHILFLGTRRAAEGPSVEVTVDGGAERLLQLSWNDDAAWVRLPIGEFDGGPHQLTVTHRGSNGSNLYLDFLEAAVTTEELPVTPEDSATTLATDWDTDHSIALAAERTAWMIWALGFRGRQNHYVGAMWFYELYRKGHQYATGEIEFAGQPEFGRTTVISIGETQISHMNLIGDSAGSLARAFALELNAGSNAVWAEADGSTLRIHARVMGAAGNEIGLAAVSDSASLEVRPNGPALAGGVDGEWRTDLTASPRINRGARDWTRGFFAALQGYGLDATAAFSMELQHGDDSLEAGIAQRYPDAGRTPVLLNTPALQTNFSPASTAFWREVYLEMAGLMQEAGLRPYLQFGEVQWWYFPGPSGMPFYDDYTQQRFEDAYGRPMRVIADGQADPAEYKDECDLLATLIGEFTDAVIQWVRNGFPDARFEVLYPPDVNDSLLNPSVNLPRAYWTPEKLDCLKTENFTYTGGRNLDKARASIELPVTIGFPRSKCSHLVGIGEYTTPWARERQLAQSQNVESVVLFALDQFCLIGYELPLSNGRVRSVYMGD